MKVKTIYLVIYNRDGRLREREFETQTCASDFSRSVSGSIAPLKVKDSHKVRKANGMLTYPV